MSTHLLPSLPVPSSSSLLQVEAPLSITKSFRPYYSPSEAIVLVRTQASAKSDGKRKELSDVRVEAWRQLACGFIERVGVRLGFPRRTIATAQMLYHRFHLHFPLRDFPYQDVSISALLVSSKLEDTLKKLRDIQNAAWQVNNLLEGGVGIGEGDLNAQEAHRPHLIAIERLILQTICFNFNLHRSPTVTTSATSEESSMEGVIDQGEEESAVIGKDVFSWVIRFSRTLGASKSYTFLAHLLAIDVHRTLAPLSFPPHTVALACLYLAAFLTPTHRLGLEWRAEEITKDTTGPEFEMGWCKGFESLEEDVEEIAHTLLNLLIALCPTPSPSLLSKPSPSYSPSPLSMTSPIDPSLNNSTFNPNRATGALAEKAASLLKSGIPHVLEAANGSFNTGTGFGMGGKGSKLLICGRTEEEFTRIKILLRAIEARREEKILLEKSKAVAGVAGGGGGGSKKRALPFEKEEEKEVGLLKVRGSERWRGSETGSRELGKEGEEKKLVSVRYRF